MKYKKAVVMLSIGGNRSWAEYAINSFRRIGPKWGADVHLITEDKAWDLDTSDLKRQPGRENKRAYALKTYYPWLFLTHHAYNKVLLVDDSCVVHPHSPNPFDEYYGSEIAVTRTASKHARESFSHLAGLAQEGRLDNVPQNTRVYGNTGVVLYDQSVASGITPSEVHKARDSLYSRFPHQTLFYYLHRKNALNVSLMNKRWNLVPGLSLEREERKGLADATQYADLKNFYIMHFTGMYKNRGALVKGLSLHYNSISVQ